MGQDKNKVFRLLGKVQHYAWGGKDFLPQLLHIPNPEGKPFAEYWMGAHDNASSEIVLSPGETVKLNEYIQTLPQQTLGTGVAAKFGRLPYLLKILDVKDMLSIQVHPSKKVAEKEFDAENKKGILPDAPHRNYKDNNHKPELMMALSEFWLLHGFKPKEHLLSILRSIPELNFLAPVFEKGGYEELYKAVMETDQAQVNEILQPLLKRIIPAYQNNQLKKDDENFWAARAALTFKESGKTDRGIFSVYFFNLLHLQPGEAIFQDEGLPHAYLEGQNVEIMANSDNVLRAGLTPKHIDVKELMKHVRFQATVPDILHATMADQYTGAYITPAPDFELGKIELLKGETIALASRSVEIFVVLKGSVLVQDTQQELFSCAQGEAFITFDLASFRVHATENTVIYRAMVPGA